MRRGKVRRQAVDRPPTRPAEHARLFGIHSAKCDDRHGRPLREGMEPLYPKRGRTRVRGGREDRGKKYAVGSVACRRLQFGAIMRRCQVQTAGAAAVSAIGSICRPGRITCKNDRVPQSRRQGSQGVVALEAGFRIEMVVAENESRIWWQLCQTTFELNIVSRVAQQPDRRQGMVRKHSGAIARYHGKGRHSSRSGALEYRGGL